jgi:hypothetical protein
MIAGYEKPSQVRAQLAAFEHERRGAQSERHLAAIAEQERIFRRELKRMEKEGVPDEDETTAPDSLSAQAAWMGGPWGETWRPRG